MEGREVVEVERTRLQHREREYPVKGLMEDQVVKTVIQEKVVGVPEEIPVILLVELV